MSCTDISTLTLPTLVQSRKGAAQPAGGFGCSPGEHATPPGDRQTLHTTPHWQPLNGNASGSFVQVRMPHTRLVGLRLYFCRPTICTAAGHDWLSLPGVAKRVKA